MRVSLTYLLLPCLCLALVVTANGGTTENFNSRNGVPIQKLRISLQNACWSFLHFDINNGWTPRLEGDGAMVAVSDALSFRNSGIYTPLLKIDDEVDVSFAYAFNENFGEEADRELKICLVDGSNNILHVLDVIKLNGVNASTPTKYATQFKNLEPGTYRIALLYHGRGGRAKIAIDQLDISATTLNDGGCRIAPAAANMDITGMHDRTASANILSALTSAKESLKVYLIKGSADGNVRIDEHGNFNFVPDKNFKGSFTSFTYKVCDEANGLCSEDGIVKLAFPSGQLVDFNGTYKLDGNVELTWNVVDNSFKKFEIERSLDGRSWRNTGIVYADAVRDGDEYAYTDRAGKNVVLKNDLYYRLKQVKTDGTEVVSRMLLVRVYNTRSVSMISVTPDPVRSDINVKFQLNENSMVSMRVFNETGTTELHKTTEAALGSNNILLEGSSKLAPGPYTLEVIVNSDERMLVKLQKD